MRGAKSLAKGRHTMARVARRMVEQAGVDVNQLREFIRRAKRNHLPFAHPSQLR